MTGEYRMFQDTAYDWATVYSEDESPPEHKRDVLEAYFMGAMRAYREVKAGRA